ncbi:hypothetical protein PLICRDRAFT_423609 [Plicaturopsis crispa FD-325 SS-3]|nr:hypothetical protein PLICRDRAFT_423609 [Plicaturopsis crispa FD-325 SS-3]
MSTRLLPAVKRYAVSTEPVREAAKFWTSFYEETAQVRIPTYEDYSSMNDHPSQSEQEDSSTPSDDGSRPETSTAHKNHEEHNSTMSSESSFMPAHAAVSSTPATASRHRAQDSFVSQNSDEDPSWTASMESPLVRLDREIQSLTRDEQPSQAPSVVYREPSQRVDKGKRRESGEPLLRNVLRQNLQSVDISNSSSLLPTPRPGHPSGVSPLHLRPKPKTPVAHVQNPYLPPSANWRNIPDLPSPSPRRDRYERNPTRHRPTTPTAPPPPSYEDDSFDDSTIDFPDGMSPPVTVKFARPPRSSIGLGLLPNLGKTPKNEAADRIRRNIMEDVERRSGGAALSLFGRGGYSGSHDMYGGHEGTRALESSMSTVPTPPSLSRYTRHAYPTGMESSSSVGLDPSLESMMRRVGLPGNHAGSAAPSHSSVSNSHGLMPPPLSSQELRTPDQQRYMYDDDGDLSTVIPLPESDADADSDSDSDSLDDEPHNTAHPSAAFLMASQHQPGSDDSFGSSNNSSDSLGEDQGGEGVAPIHPFARGYSEDEQGDGFDDDSFEDEYERPGGEEETLFGVPPAQRLQQANARGGQLRLLGENLLADTIGIGAAMARTGTVEESPTPWAGGPKG